MKGEQKELLFIHPSPFRLHPFSVIISLQTAKEKQKLNKN